MPAVFGFRFLPCELPLSFGFGFPFGPLFDFTFLLRLLQLQADRFVSFGCNLNFGDLTAHLALPPLEVGCNWLSWDDGHTSRQ
jgi:hypothetical protein